MKPISSEMVSAASSRARANKLSSAELVSASPEQSWKPVTVTSDDVKLHLSDLKESRKNRTLTDIVNRSFQKERDARENKIIARLNKFIHIGILLTVVVSIVFVYLAIAQFRHRDKVSERWERFKCRYSAVNDAFTWLGPIVNGYFLYYAR
mmetsp:Transcript_26657/g.64580  ORF Transcript_26657/g.64580 Transcript_26657/m.64580 type:complete len:151 (+) Transcript_26657:421-873(+)|eukprot:CAMPEP_0114504530 /NCGR_PEP_ID=MMETSP0109-20121206/10284_1 /TAXON_ID=29199 /ORGANISM="Chlorarachnion reptans, Strain CCCM449" /LENGTH=150 /DNA_ID=CAMNT_0001682739 /DNA_START=668 /DNA_END=1120 /DNA_ORIENTATION=-